jgi:hypothetical protein
MRHLTRAMTAMAAATALAAGLLTATAGVASAVTLPQPQKLETSGVNYGYGMRWEAPANTEGLTAYKSRLYLATDTGFAAPLKSQTLQPDDFTRDEIWTDFTGLTPGTRYVGTVASVFGSSESDPVIGDIDQAYRPIGKVGSLKVVPGNKQIKVSWKRPATDALTGPLTAYLVIAETGDEWSFPELVFGQPSDTSATLTGLTNGEKYTVTVMAGSTDAGLSAIATARPLGKPAKPKSLTVSWVGKGKAKLTWKAPKSTKAAPVTGYVVHVGGKKVKTLKGKKSTSIKVKAGKSGKKYRFSVRAYNPVTKSNATVKKAKRP